MIADTRKIIYTNEEVTKKNFERLSLFYIFCYYVMPQYFGLDIKLFQFSIQRIAMAFLLLYIVLDRKRIRDFWDVLRGHKLTPAFLIYLLMCTYTAVFRANVNTLLYPLIEIVCAFLLAYVLKEVISLERFLRIIKIFLWILAVEGVIESVLGRSLFSYLVTMQGTYSGVLYRGGAYRVMGPCNHSIGYGLLLVAGTPFICFDYKTDKVNLLQNKMLLVLLTYNVFMTGSRSSLAVYLLELFLIFLISPLKNKKKSFLILAMCIVALAAVVVVTWGSSFSNYVMMQLSCLIDEMFNTTLAANFGANIEGLHNSSYYREILLRIFSLDYLNPIIGRGTGYHFSWYVEGYKIESIDNFYVATYIKYAYPGIITTLLIAVVSWYYMIKSWIKEKSGFAACMFLASLLYYLNLWWVDTLGTIKYAYIVLITYFTFRDNKGINAKNEQNAQETIDKVNRRV